MRVPITEAERHKRLAVTVKYLLRQILIKRIRRDLVTVIKNSNPNDTTGSENNRCKRPELQYTVQARS